MSMSGVPFDKRLRSIVREHTRMSHGAVHAIRHDGLITVRPRKYNPRFPLKGLMMVLGVSILFKAYILADLGQATYNQRVGALAEGSVFEKAGAWLMQPDTVTTGVAGVMRSLLGL